MFSPTPKNLNFTPPKGHFGGSGTPGGHFGPPGPEFPHFGGWGPFWPPRTVRTGQGSNPARPAGQKSPATKVENPAKSRFLPKMGVKSGHLLRFSQKQGPYPGKSGKIREKMAKFWPIYRICAHSGILSRNFRDFRPRNPKISGYLPRKISKSHFTREFCAPFWRFSRFCGVLPEISGNFRGFSGPRGPKMAFLGAYLPDLRPYPPKMAIGATAFPYYSRELHSYP